MQVKISRMKTAEYADLRNKRLVAVKKMRNKKTINTPRHYIAMVNGISCNGRILSRKKIERIKNNRTEG